MAFPLASFYEELHNKKAFYADIDYYVVTYDRVGYAVVSSTSKNPELFLEMVKNKLNSISVEDLDEEILDIYLRHVKSKSILKLDKVTNLGEEILSLYLENIDFFEDLERLRKIDLTVFKDYINYLKLSKKICCFCKKS